MASFKLIIIQNFRTNSFDHIFTLCNLPENFNVWKKVLGSFSLQARCDVKTVTAVILIGSIARR